MFHFFSCRFHAEGSVNFVEKHQPASICWNKPLWTHEIAGKSQVNPSNWGILGWLEVVMVCPLPGWRTSASSWTWSSHLRWVSGASGTPSLASKSACFRGVGLWKIRILLHTCWRMMNDWQREDETSHWTVYNQKESHCNKLDTATPEILGELPGHPGISGRTCRSRFAKKWLGKPSDRRRCGRPRAHWRRDDLAEELLVVLVPESWKQTEPSMFRPLVSQIAETFALSNLLFPSYTMTELLQEEFGNLWDAFLFCSFVFLPALNPVDDPSDSFSKMAEWPFHEFALDWLPPDSASNSAGMQVIKGLVLRKKHQQTNKNKNNQQIQQTNKNKQKTTIIIN